MSSGVRSVLVPRQVDIRRPGQLGNVESRASLGVLCRVRQVEEELVADVVLAGSMTTTTTMTMTTAMTKATRRRRRPPPHDHRESDKEKDGDRNCEEYSGNNDDDDVDGEDDADGIVVNSPKR